MSHSIGVFFAGYSVSLQESQHWSESVNDAKLSARTVFAIAGPTDALYNRGKFNVAALASAVAADTRNMQPGQRIVVVAHSSGSFAAHEFLQALAVLSLPQGTRVQYFNLDGGVDRITPRVLSFVTSLVAVRAVDVQSGVKSRNYATMTGLATWARPKTQLYEVKVRRKLLFVSCF